MPLVWLTKVFPPLVSRTSASKMKDSPALKKSPQWLSEAQNLTPPMITELEQPLIASSTALACRPLINTSTVFDSQSPTTLRLITLNSMMFASFMRNTILSNLDKDLKKILLKFVSVYKKFRFQHTVTKNQMMRESHATRRRITVIRATLQDLSSLLFLSSYLIDSSCGIS